MKPNFALSLSFDGIRLLHRAAGGWRLVGEVSLDAADMGTELAMLRRTAASLEPGGARSKLLIPNTQIRYLTIETPGMADADRLEAARAALEGATPYPVSELAFDISIDGDQTHVAAVARETLEEAEAFAVEHRFYPVSFAAVPDDQPYLGEPWFGPTQAAPGLLEEGETVEPDGIAVVVVGATMASAAQASDVPDPGPAEVPQPDSPEVPDGDDPAPVEPPAESPQPVDPVPHAQPEEAPQTMAADVPDPAPTEVPATETPEITDPGDPAPAEPPAESPQPTDPEPPSRPEEAPEQRAAADVPDPAPTEVPSPDRPEITDPSDPAPVSPPDEAPQPSDPEPPARPEEAPDSPPADPTPVIPPREEPPLPDPQPDLPDETPDTPPDEAPMPQDPPGPAVPPAGAEPPAAWIPSLRAAREAEAARNLDAPGPAPSPGFASRRGGAEKVPARRKEPALVAVPAAAAVASGAPAVSAMAAAPAPIAPDSRSLAPDPTPAEAPPPARPGFLSRRKPQVRTTPAPAGVAAGAAVAAPASEAERMTVFGARRSDVGGKPRFLGLMLTAALLVFLAGVAAWASVFLDEGLNLSRLFRDRAPEVATAPADIDPETGIVDPEPLVLQSDEDTPGPVETASLEPGLSAEDGAVLDALSEPVAEEPPVPMTEEEVEARYAATGIWPRAPELPPAPAAIIDIEDLYLTSIDPVSTASDAVALPPAESFTSDVTLAALPSPAAPGTAFDLGPDGMVEPTAEGAVTPDGALVFLGRPPVVPPETPTRFQAVPQDTAERVALAAFRPRDRPEDLTENAERAQNDGLTNSELAGFRPRLRPQSVQEAAAEAAAPAELPETVAPEDTDNAVAAALATPPAPASPAAAASLVVAAPRPILENATRNAAAQSIRPDTRPRNFNRIVRRAERSRPAQEDTEVVSAAAVAPRVVQPAIPSSASVAGTATMKNAINLRKVNLIGVYGKPSARRALVRLSNGSYKKVVVGDRIDGGRVAAIGDSELVYSKGGRNLVLKMPNG